MPYSRPYPGGFVDFPSTTTPINASTLNTMDVGIKTANDQFQTVTTAQRAALVPTVGQAVWDSDLKQLMVFMNASGGNAWQPVGNRIVCASTTRPSSPFEGQEIYETDTQKTLVYNGTSWFEVGDLDNTGGLSDAGLAQTVRVFTNEAARDAAITSPAEGQIVYLTSPTVPSASGDSYAAIPSGIETIYNGSTWVCVTPVGAATITAGTTTSTSYTATLSGGGTNPSVTLSTGARALVTINAQGFPSGAATMYMSFAVSGATTVAASDANGIVVAQLSANIRLGMTASFVMTGLTAGTNTFTLNYKTSASTLTMENRRITVVGVV